MNDDSVQSQNQPKEHPREFILPGTIVVQCGHPADTDPREIARLMNVHLRNPEVENGLGLANDVQPVKPRNILTVPRAENQPMTFSIMPIELKRSDRQTVIDILLHMKKVHKGEPFELAPNVVWQSAAPNWLLGSAGHGSPHPPSPGSWPLAKSAPTQQDWEFSLLEKYPSKVRPWPAAFANGGAKVHVAILDTAPCPSDLDEAYETWNSTIDLVKRLLKPEPNRQLRLITDIYAEMDLLDSSLAGHRYWMADHGLFIAGEIASIAPESVIHLYKVFTSFGSASTLTLAQGLLRVLTDLADGEIERPLVVNCSFGLAAPGPGQNDPDFPVELKDPAMQTSLRALFDELTNQDQVIVVAAAGDDTDPDPISNPTRQRSQARFPAAYERVIGVGAMPKKSQLNNSHFAAASYANLADDDPSDGYVTLGGEPGAGKGILGLFTSEIPYFPGELGGKPPKDPKEATRDHLKYKKMMTAVFGGLVHPLQRLLLRESWQGGAVNSSARRCRSRSRMPNRP